MFSVIFLIGKFRRPDLLRNISDIQNFDFAFKDFTFFSDQSPCGFMFRCQNCGVLGNKIEYLDHVLVKHMNLIRLELSKHTSDKAWLKNKEEQSYR